MLLPGWSACSTHAPTRSGSSVVAATVQSEVFFGVKISGKLLVAEQRIAGFCESW